MAGGGGALVVDCGGEERDGGERDGGERDGDDGWEDGTRCCSKVTSEGTEKEEDREGWVWWVGMGGGGSECVTKGLFELNGLFELGAHA